MFSRDPVHRSSLGRPGAPLPPLPPCRCCSSFELRPRMHNIKRTSGWWCNPGFGLQGGGGGLWIRPQMNNNIESLEKEEKKIKGAIPSTTKNPTPGPSACVHTSMKPEHFWQMCSCGSIWHNIMPTGKEMSRKPYRSSCSCTTIWRELENHFLKFRFLCLMWTRGHQLSLLHHTLALIGCMFIKWREEAVLKILLINHIDWRLKRQRHVHHRLNSPHMSGNQGDQLMEFWRSNIVPFWSDVRPELLLCHIFAFMMFQMFSAGWSGLKVPWTKT